MTKTILLIHGAWLNGLGWEGFKARYEAKGYTVLTPSWPGNERSPAELRAHPDKAQAKIGQRAIIDHYERIVRALPEQPIIIGHSLGGVFTQHLLDRGLGVAGVAIDPAPTPGVPLGPHAIVSALPVLGDPWSASKMKQMSRHFFKTRFAQALPAEMQDAHYDRYIVPTSGKVYWDGVIGSLPIKWKNPDRAPLLLIGGEKDLIADASMTRAIYAKQKKAPSKTDYKEYAGRSHWTCAEPGWEEVADFALDWAVRNMRGANVSPMKTANAA